MPPFAVVLLCSLYFVNDALRRPFRGDRNMALVLAGFGVGSFGFLSLFYYGIWGRFPIPKPDDVFSNNFCDRCLTTTTDESAPDQKSHSPFAGIFFGISAPCPDCKSVGCTLWAWFLFPMIPVGSYRIISLDNTHQVSRRLPSRDAKHIARVYWINLLVAIAILAFYFRRYF
jgi:hypothetical protein